MIIPGYLLLALLLCLPLHLYSVICFPWLWSTDSMLYIWFNIGWFSLLFSITSIELGDSVYITQFMFSLFFISLFAIFIVVNSAVWIEASSDSGLFWWCPRILLCSMIRQCRLPCYYCDFFCVVTSTVFSPRVFFTDIAE